MEKKYFKLIFFLSLVLSVIGIASEIFDYYNYKNYEPSTLNMSIQYFLWIFRSLYVFIGFERTPLNVYNIIFYILLFFGSIFFYISKGKELRLIRFFYSVLLISNVFMLLRIILGNTVFKNLKIPADLQLQMSVFEIIGFLLCIFYAFLGYKILRIIAVGTELDTFKKADSDIINVTETPRIDRFIHMFFDIIIMVFLMFVILELIVNYYKFQSESIPEWLGNRFVIFIFYLFIRFTYYPFFEKIFGATPGKFLTNSRVINLKSEILDTANIFERTFYRHIPFEAFSFFGKRGWHDSFSETYVVKEKGSSVKSIYIVGVFVLCFVILCYYLYSNSSLEERF
jgi:uncharacterized RDD family membrane protein YckC